MSETVAARPASKEGKESVSYLDAGYTLISWLATTDHKRIGILYSISITIFFLIGGLAIGLVRLELMSIDAVRNAITEPWSNGQTEGQINRLKALKRTMYGRAGPELLRARLLPV